MNDNRSAEQRMQEQDHAIAAVLENISQPIIVASADKRLLLWNAAFPKLTGYTDEELRDPIISAGLTAPEWHESEAKAFEKLRRTGQTQTFQKEYIRKDGSRIPVEMLVYQLTDDKGKVRYYVGLIIDITERRVAEEALRESEEKYRTILEDIKEGYWEVDLAGNFTFFNDAICRLLGYSRKELKGINYRAHTDAGDVDKVYRAFNKVYRTGKPIRNMHYEVISKDGSKKFAETSVFARRNGKGEIIGFRGVSHDITERMQTEDALKRSEERYRTILEEIQDAYFEVDLTGNFTFGNNSFYRYVGYPTGKLIGVNYRIVTATDDVEKVYQGFNQVYRTGIPINNLAYKVVRKDTSTGHVEIAVSPIRNARDEIVGFRGIGRDITERVEIEEALRLSEARYRTILEDIQEAYSEVDLAGNFTFFNNELCRHLGYSKEELMGMNYKVYTSPDNVKSVFQAYNQVYRTGEPIQLFAIKEIRKDGKRMIAEISVAPLRNETGEIIGFRGLSRDTTDRIQMEEALRQSEERYRTILEDMEESYYEDNLAGNFTFVNDALCRQLGYSKEELIGMNYRTYTPPEEVESVFQIYNQIYRTGEPNKLFATKQIRKDGTRIVAENSAIPIRNESGEIIGFRGVARDVTERLRIEEALKQSEEKYRTVLDGMEESYYEVDHAGNFTFFNDALCHQLGYSREELMGMNYKVYTPPEKAKEVFQAYNQVYRTGEPTKLFDMAQTKKDGTRIVIENSIFPLRNEQGEIIGFRGVGRDVTERKQMEEALRRSEERYRTVLEDMEEAYYEIDIAGNFTFFNDALCRQLDYSPEELRGMNYKAYTSPEKVKEVFQIFNQVYRTGKPAKSFFTERIRKDGTVVFAENSAFPMKNENGETIGFRGVIRDITERKQMEEAVRRSEERYRSLLDDMEEGYYENDLTGNFTFVNDALCHALGYSKEELIGMNYKVYTPPEEVERVFQAYNQMYRTGEPIRLLTRESIHKDGRRLSAETSILPLKNERGEIIGFRGVSRDITERKKAEEEKKQLEQKAQLASRLASVGELASGVAHEINNPLTGVIGYAHLLLARKDIPKDMIRDVEIINEGAQRVSSIVKKLLAFARQTRPEQRYVNINELINNTLDLQAYALAANNIKVSLQLTRDLPMTIADPGQLQQVFLNLIMNAEAAMKSTRDKGKLSIKTEHVDNIIRISFKDNGPGIAKENLVSIFDPFFTTREVGQGTGLGLSVCHGIITEHKGRIWVESEPDKGATFIVELPILTEDRRLGVDVPEPVITESKKTAKAKILVIDDEPVILQLVSQVLAEEGHIVETAGNAADALKMVKSKRYRLILLDIKMPGMSGVELYKQFQKIAPSLTKRIVFITGDIMGKRTLAFLDKTKAPYVMKPFDAKQLKTEIRHILARK